MLKDETTKEAATADLIFGFYETKGTEGMELLEMFAVPRDSINLSKVKRTCLQQPVIVCSTIDMASFKAFTKQKGALGSLEVPLDIEKLKACCIEHKLIPE